MWQLTMNAPTYNTGSRGSYESLAVGRIPKNSGEEVVVTLSRFKGHDLLDLRIHALFGGADTRRPTRKGISINITRLPDLLAVLHTADAEAHRLGLLADAADGRVADTGPKDRTAAEPQRRLRERLRASRCHRTDVTDQNVTAPSLFAEN